MANIGSTDTVPSMLTPGEVVLNEEQITLLGKITGRNPYELFAAAGVPGSEEQFAGTEGGQVPQGYRGGGVISDSPHENIDNLIMQNDMNDYSPSLLNMVQGYTHGTVSVRPEDMYAGLGYLDPGEDYTPETLPYDPSAQYGMYGEAAGSYAEQVRKRQPGKGGLKRGIYGANIEEARKKGTSEVASKVGGARQTQLDKQIAGFYQDVREGVISPTKIEDYVPDYYEFGYEEQYEPSTGAPPGWPTYQAYIEWRGAGSNPDTAVNYGYTGSGTPGYKPEPEYNPMSSYIY